MSFFVHETSIVDDNCQLGDNTKVWHFSHILKGSVIGENCSFGQNCVVGPNVKMGSGIKVQNNVSIYEGVEVEDDVFLGPSMVFTNVINPRSFIVRKEEFKPTILRKGCSIGANATIVCGNEIGTYALVGSGTVIVKPVKPFALVVGVPGKQIGWVSIAGNRLNFDAENKAKDTADGSQYQLKNNDVVILKR
jgi:UDP-2-acetamido-3-amino-2,3-dideoxy-glucuronate N-acetyltransferase